MLSIPCSRSFRSLNRHRLFWRVVARELNPSRRARLPHFPVNLDSLTGKHGDVVVVIFDGENLVAAAGRRDLCAFEEGHLAGGVTQTDGDVILAVGLGLACVPLQQSLPPLIQ